MFIISSISIIIIAPYIGGVIDSHAASYVLPCQIWTLAQTFSTPCPWECPKSNRLLIGRKSACGP